MLLHLALIAAGVVALVAAGRLVSKTLVVIAHHLGVSEFAIAFFLLAFSTTIPEFFVAVSAALNGTPALALGNAFGSNIINLTLIAGLVIILGRQNIAVHAEITRKQGAWMFGIGALPVLFLLDGSISRIDGVVLLAAFFMYLVRLSRERKLVVSAVKGEMETEESGSFLRLLQLRSHESREFIINICWFAAGVAALLAGARLVVESSQALALDLGASQFFVGLFVVAVGTSLPELSFGIRAALTKHPEISIGDIMGAVAMNSAWILGTAALIQPIVPIALLGALFVGLFMVAVFLAFFFLMNRGGALFPREGWALVALYVLFVAWQAMYGA